MINDVIEDCVDNMHNIIQSQHDAVKNRQEFIKEITRRNCCIQRKENNYDTSILHRTYGGY